MFIEINIAYQKERTIQQRMADFEMNRCVISSIIKKKNCKTEFINTNKKRRGKQFEKMNSITEIINGITDYSIGLKMENN